MAASKAGAADTASNAEIARVLRELANLTKLEDASPQSFRARAFERAAQAVQDLGPPAAEMSAAQLTQLDGVGKSIAAKIREYVDEGSLRKLDELRSTFPSGFAELARIPGLGPKTLAVLRRELGVENLDDLRRAVDQQRLRDLPGLGAKTEENVARAIERLGLHGKERRTPVGVAWRVAAEVADALRTVPGVEAVQPAGSLRRFRDTIGDVDVVVAAAAAEPVMERFVGLSLAAEVLARGPTKSAIRTWDELQVDLRVVEPGQLGAALLYFTGSKDHNIALRSRALQRGWTLNEYALSDAETGNVVAAATEAAVYEALGLAFVPPELREGLGEVELAEEGALPDLVARDDLRGDLHDHTTLSGDGRATLEEMAEAAAGLGLEYLAITDHGEDLTINGVGRGEMLRQRKRIADLQRRLDGLVLLHGCELNIDRDGNVDYDSEFRAGFDWCVASVHSLFDMDAAVQTRRLLTAMRDPTIHAIGHLSGRKIGRRPGIEFDVDAVLDAAAETGTVIEINGAVDRLDATAEVLRRSRGRNVLFSISTDSHRTSEFARFEWGIRHARRGWVEKDSVVNTWPRERFLEWLADRNRRP